jgi:hypothetical protein
VSIINFLFPDIGGSSARKRCVRGVSQSRTESLLLFCPSAALRTAITRLISGPEDHRTKERQPRDLARLPNLDQTLDAALARVSHMREFFCRRP